MAVGFLGGVIENEARIAILFPFAFVIAGRKRGLPARTVKREACWSLTRISMAKSIVSPGS